MFHSHSFWFKLLPHEELKQIYLSAAIRSFSLSLVGLFIPLFLYHERGVSFSNTLLFYIFFSSIFALFTPLAAKFAARFGIKHSVLVSIPIYLGFLCAIYLLSPTTPNLFIMGSLLGLSLALYWMGMNLIFHRASDHKHRGEEVGKKLGYSILAAMIGPLIGGFLISTVGFLPVFILSALIQLVAAYVLFLSKENHIRYHFSLLSILNKHNWRLSVFYLTRGSHAIAETVLWPIFVFVILGSYLKLGLLGFLLSLISAILVWTIGRYSDRNDKRKIVWALTPLEAVTWFGRTLATGVSHVVGITIAGAITHGVRDSPLSALEFDKARGDITTYFVHREIFLCVGRIILLSLVLVTDSLTSGFLFQGILSLGALLI